MTKEYYRRGGAIPEPVAEHAHYVVGDDMVETESVEVVRAYVPNQAVNQAIATLQSKHYPDASTDQLLQAVASDTDLTAFFGTPDGDASDPQTRRESARNTAPALADFDTVDVATVAAAPAETVKVERVVEQQDVQKTGLVHPDEVRDTDTVIW